jgi:hypothetical protein
MAGKRIRKGMGLLLLAVFAWLFAQLMVDVSGSAIVYGLAWLLAAALTITGMGLLLVGLLRD